jgi:hypothetical protein
MASRIVGLFAVMVVGCQPEVPEVPEVKPSPAAEPEQVQVPVPPPAVVLPVAPPCEAALSDPVALFNDHVLIRLPVGVEVTEVTPVLARSGEAEMASACGAMVRHVSIGSIAAAPERPVLEVRDALFTTVYGVSPGGVRWTDEAAKGRSWAGSFTLPEVPGKRVPLRGGFALKEKGELVVWALYEAHADVYPTLAETFKASSQRLLVVPQ